MLIWPKEFHWDKNSYLSYFEQFAELEHISTSKSIPEMGPLSDPKTNVDLGRLMSSAMNTFIQTKPKRNKSNQLNDSSSQKSLHNLKFDVSSVNQPAEVQPEADAERTPVYLLTVNNQNQLFYTLLSEDSADARAGLVFETRVQHTFDENISTVTHIDSGDFVLLCGYPHIFFWNVREKRLQHKYALPVHREPWFTVWDVLYIRKKQTFVFGLNNGLVLQLLWNAVSQDFEDPKLFQSNDEGKGVYSLVYLPAVDKILATNNNNILTEFVFQVPKKEKGKFAGSSKNIPPLREPNLVGLKSKSIRNISVYDKKRRSEQVKSKSNSKAEYGPRMMG